MLDPRSAKSFPCAITIITIDETLRSPASGGISSGIIPCQNSYAHRHMVSPGIPFIMTASVPGKPVHFRIATTCSIKTRSRGKRWVFRPFAYFQFFIVRNTISAVVSYTFSDSQSGPKVSSHISIYRKLYVDCTLLRFSRYLFQT